MGELLFQLNDLPANSPLYFGLVVLAGLLMGVAPSSLPLMSVVVGSVAGQGVGPTESGVGAPKTARRRAFLFASGFVLGLATVDALIGALFALIGFAIVQTLASSLAVSNFLIALLLAVMGLALLRIIRIPGLGFDARPRKVSSFAGAYALGIPFGLRTCPACTPMILPVLGAAAATGTPWLGAVLMFAFGLARGVPLVLAGAITGGAASFRPAMRWIPKIERLGGVVVLVAGVFFLYQSAAYAGLAPPIFLGAQF